MTDLGHRATEPPTQATYIAAYEQVAGIKMIDNDNGGELDQADDAGPSLTIALVGEQWRIYYGYEDSRGGRYVTVEYDDIRDHVIGRKPRAELIEIYHLAD